MRRRTKCGFVVSVVLALTGLGGAGTAIADGHTYTCTITYTNRNGVVVTDTFVTGSRTIIQYVETHGGTCSPRTTGQGP
jgi:hypothetical protein